MTEYYGSGRFCSEFCSKSWVSRNQSEDAKQRKIIAGQNNLTHHGMPSKFWTKERREIHSRKMKLVMSNPETRKKISDSSKGRILSLETRKKISEKVKLSHIEGRNKGWTTRRNRESYAEKFWRIVLENNNIQYKQEFKVDKPGPGCYFLDFLLLGNVDLEIDGHQHYEESRKLKDHERDEYLRSKGYIVYRIKYVDPRNSLRVKEDIDKFLSWYWNFDTSFYIGDTINEKEESNKIQINQKKSNERKYKGDV